MITEEKLDEIEKSLKLYHLSCNNGSPSDKQIAEEQMLDNAPYSLRLLIQAVKDLRETLNGQYHSRLNQHNQLLINAMFSLLTPEQHEELTKTPHYSTTPPLANPDKLVALSAQYWHRAAREAPDAHNAAFCQHEAYKHVVNQLYGQRDMYEEREAEVKRLTRELDVALHGEKGAAEQASLVDLISPAQKMRLRFLLMQYCSLDMKGADAVLANPKQLAEHMTQLEFLGDEFRRP